MGMAARILKGVGMRDGIGADRPKLERQTIPMRDATEGRTRNEQAGFMDMDRIIADPEQVRKEFDDAELQNLAKSIAKFGQLMPITIRWDDEHGKHFVVHGERRYRAMKMLGKDSISVIFHDGEISESEKLEEQLTENCLRSDLKPMEAAQAFQKLMALNDWNAQQLAEALCLSKSHVSQRIALLRLPADIQERVADGRLTGESGYELSKIRDADKRKAAAEKIEAEKLTRSETRKLVQGVNKKSPGKRKSRPYTTKKFDLGICKVTFTFGKKTVTNKDIQAAIAKLSEQVEFSRVDAGDGAEHQECRIELL